VFIRFKRGLVQPVSGGIRSCALRVEFDSADAYLVGDGNVTTAVRLKYSVELLANCHADANNTLSDCLAQMASTGSDCFLAFANISIGKRLVPIFTVVYEIEVLEKETYSFRN
jgi:hypothetical protein